MRPLPQRTGDADQDRDRARLGDRGARIADAGERSEARDERLSSLQKEWTQDRSTLQAEIKALSSAGDTLRQETIKLSHALSKERSARLSNAQALAILADQASRRIPLSAGRGDVVVDPSGRGVLVVRRLPAAPSDKTYEAWVIPHGGAGTPRPAGLFAGGDRTTIVRLKQMVPRGAVVAATVERAGGVDAPTQKPFLVSAQS